MLGRETGRMPRRGDLPRDLSTPASCQQLGDSACSARRVRAALTLPRAATAIESAPCASRSPSSCWSNRPNCFRPRLETPLPRRRTKRPSRPSAPPSSARTTPSSSTASPCATASKLFTSVYVPKDVFSDGRTYPIMMERTGYNVAPYGADLYRTNLGPSELFEREKFIFVYQDVRGRFMSEGDFVTIRPQKAGERRTERHRREHRHIRHHRLAGEARSRQYRQGGDLGHIAAGFLCDRGQ